MLTIIRNAGILVGLLLVLTPAFVYSQVQPDLVIRRVTVTKDRTKLFVDKITVHVSNTCKDSTAAVNYVTVTFKESKAPGAKTILSVGNSVKLLNGGESHIQTFDVSEKKIGAGRHIRTEVDPNKKVIEASESNNWYTVNPFGAGTGLAQAQCTPKM